MNIMSDLYSVLYKNRIIELEEYNKKCNEDKQISLQQEKLLSNLNNLIEFKNEQNNKIISKELILLQSIEEKLNNPIFIRYFKGNMEKTINDLSFSRDDSIKIGRGITQLVQLNEFLDKNIENQNNLENAKIDEISNSISDISKEEQNMINYYIRQEKFKDIIQHLDNKF